MTSTDLRALLPLIVLAAAAVLTLITIAVRRRHLLTAGCAMLGLLATALALPSASRVAPRTVTPLLILDGYAFFFIAVFAATAAAVLLLAYNYLAVRHEHREEFYVALLLATLGGAVLAAANHFASFFLGLETLSVALYMLIAYTRSKDQPIEAAIKYLLLAGASSAFLLFGMALLYARTGHLDFAGLAATAGSLQTDPTVITGWALLLVGIGFKLALVPFHMWTPDVYAGAPVPVTALIATISKGAVFALLLRFVVTTGGIPSDTALFSLLSLMAVLSMFAGNLLALLQTNLKRLLAYSSIAHLGYLMVALLAAGDFGTEAAIVYLVIYMATILTAFAVVAAVSEPDEEATDLEAYAGLFWRFPTLAAVFTVSLLSLAGIPLTAGFIGKLYLLAAGAASAVWLLALMIVLNSAIALYYYLRVIVVMARPPASAADRPAAHDLAWGPAIVLGVMGILLVLAGVYPPPLQSAVDAALRHVL